MESQNVIHAPAGFINATLLKSINCKTLKPTGLGSKYYSLKHYASVIIGFESVIFKTILH